MKGKWTRSGLSPYTTHHIFGISAGTALGIAGSAASAAGSLFGGSAGSDAAGAAAGLQKEYIDLGINELRGALGPSMERLDEAQQWSDEQLAGYLRQGMRETQPYKRAGRYGLNQLSLLMGDAGPAPKAPKAPIYKGYRPGGNAGPGGATGRNGMAQAGGTGRPRDFKPNKADFKDPKDFQAARAQFQQYVKDSREYEKANAAYEARVNDPRRGSLMKPYEDRFEGQIDEVAKRQYNDKYAQEILDTARDKFEAADFEADPGYEFRRSEGNRGIEQSAAARGSLQSGAALKELTRFNQDTASNEFDRAHGRWADQRNTHLAGVSGQQAFDYGAWNQQKGAELDTLVNQRNFDFGSFDNNRNFQVGALTGMVGVGQDAINDRNQLRQYFGGTRSQNAINNAVQQGNWQQNTAAQIAEFLSQSGNAQAAGEVGSANAWGNAFEGGANALGTALGYFGGRGNTAGGRRPNRTAQGDNGFTLSY